MVVVVVLDSQSCRNDGHEGDESQSCNTADDAHTIFCVIPRDSVQD